jgi:hypothetical protein
MKRLLLLLIVAGVIAWLVKSQGLLHTAAPAVGERGSPIERARAAARKSEARTSAGEAVGREADQPAGGAAITENMTPEQVRGLLGSPDEVRSETTSSGASRETWTYRSVGKTVVFENGIAVSVQ